MAVIREITDAMQAVDGVRVLDTDPGKATNRTVVTLVGDPEAVIEAAFRGIARAAELIDMTQHKGEHPRMGATDVCPLIPVAGVTMEEAADYAHRLAKRIGTELAIPTYMYEAAATRPERRNLATIRGGEYEGFFEKIKQPDWQPDYGPATMNARSGATVVGARDFLVAYNVNLNTTSVRRANSVAFDVREQGRIVREGDPLTGKPKLDASGEPIRIAGKCKGVKGIGWYIAEYGIAQVSMNITNIHDTALHTAFEACVESAAARGMRVTGSELVGLVPLAVMLDAGRYFLHRQERSAGVSDAELIRIAVKSMGLDELAPFDARKKIIEYLLEDTAAAPLVGMTLTAFADETASESPAPGGGSIAAYAGALGASLATMVANLSSHKRGWDERWATFSEYAERGQALKKALLANVDADTAAFNRIMDAFALPKSTADEKAARKNAIQAATQHAIEVPLSVMRLGRDTLALCAAMAKDGNPNSVSDAGVGALCARTAVYGAYLNVRINATGLTDPARATFLTAALAEAEALLAETEAAERAVLETVRSVIEA